MRLCSFVLTPRPALKHLDSALKQLKMVLNDPTGCIAEAEAHVANFFGNVIPHSSTPKYGNDERRGILTPNTSVDAKRTPASSNLAVCREKLLEKYGIPPSLTPWNGIPSPLVRQGFKPPARKSPAV